MSDQQTPPEVIKWIAEQAVAGIKPEVVLAALRANGWSEQTARTAIEDTKRFLQSQAPVQPPKPVAVPGPDLSSRPWMVRTSDREVHVLATMELPRVIVFGGLLSHEECDGLMELARPRLKRSNTLDSRTGGEELTEARTSYGMFFDRGESELVRRIESRIAELVAWPVDHGEGLQVLRYGIGAEYRPHYDYFDPAVPSTPVILERGGQRVASLVMYLHTSPKGGGTIFPNVGLQIAPVKGNAVFFSYNAPHPSTGTLHAGAPVIEGEKWIVTKWLREGVFV
jgi:prolyl 4-hydroxylase